MKQSIARYLIISCLLVVVAIESAEKKEEKKQSKGSHSGLSLVFDPSALRPLKKDASNVSDSISTHMKEIGKVIDSSGKILKETVTSSTEQLGKAFTEATHTL